MSSLCLHRDEFLDGALSPDRAAAFEAHLLQCAECRRAVELWRSQHALIAQWAAADPAPPQAVTRLIARARSPRASSRARSLWVVGGLAVAALAVALFVFRPAPERPAPQVLVAEGEPLTTTMGGDTLTLTAGSRAEVWREQKDTRVRVLTGASSFRVVKRSAGERFVVEVGPLEVRVVGTVFHARAGAEPTVFVTEGVVEVWRGATQVARLTRGEAYDGSRRAARPEELSLLEGPPAKTPLEPQPPPEPGARDAGIVALVPQRPRALTLDADAVTRAMVENRLADATKLVTSHLARAPKDATAWLLLGDIRRKSGTPAPAVAAYQRAIAVGNPALRNRARLLAASLLQDSMGKERAARLLLEAYLKEPVSARPLEAPVLVRLARLDIAAKATRAARRRLELVLSRHPTTPAAVEARELLSHLPSK